MDNPLNIDADGQSAIDANKLCQSCGICCNGALFSYVSVTGSEAKVLEKEGVTLKKADKNTYRFNLPCTKFKDGGCSIYTSRPKKCASFYCKLAESVLNESVSFEDAHTHVVTLKFRMDWLNKRIETMPDLEPENDEKMGLRDYIGVYCFNTMKTISKKTANPGRTGIYQIRLRECETGSPVFLGNQPAGKICGACAENSV